MKLRILKEGAGAGYTIEIKGLSDISIESASVEDFKEIDEFDKGWIVNVSGSCTIDELQANSYYYGTEKLEDIPADIKKVYINWYWTDDDFDPSNLSESELCSFIADYLYDHFDEMKYLYGWGWIHSTYDGTIGKIDDKSDNEVELQITSESVIKYIDEAVSGDNTYITFQIVIDGYDIYDTVDDEDEALQIANDLTYDDYYKDSTITVDRVTEYVNYNGEEIDTTTEQIWEN